MRLQLSSRSDSPFRIPAAASVPESPRLRQTWRAHRDHRRRAARKVGLDQPATRGVRRRDASL